MEILLILNEIQRNIVYIVFKINCKSLIIPALIKQSFPRNYLSFLSLISHETLEFIDTLDENKHFFPQVRNHAS